MAEIHKDYSKNPAESYLEAFEYAKKFAAHQGIEIRTVEEAIPILREYLAKLNKALAEMEGYYKFTRSQRKN